MAAQALDSAADVSLLAVVTNAPAVPAVNVTAPDFAMISEPFSYSITFDNTGTAPGYGPFVDERLARGLDSTGPPTLFGSPVPVVATVDNSTGTSAVNFLHPYTGETIIINPGEEYRVYELPFGSVVPAQPPFDLQLSAITDKTEGAQVGVALNIDARGGFRFGLDPVDNPTTDPPIVSPVDREPVTPTVFEVSKVVIAPESETVTGPNFPKSFRLTVDVANGETITGLNITDVMPANLQYIPGSLTVTGGGAFTTISEPLVPTTFGAAGRTLALSFPSVTGALGNSDITIEYDFFVPEFGPPVPGFPPGPSGTRSGHWPVRDLDKWSQWLGHLRSGWRGGSASSGANPGHRGATGPIAKHRNTHRQIAGDPEGRRTSQRRRSNGSRTARHVAIYHQRPGLRFFRV